MTGVEALAGFSADELLSVAASIEAGSEHPLAEAIVLRRARKNLAIGKAADFESVAGKGVKGVVGGRRVLLGNAALMDGEGISFASHRWHASPSGAATARP